MSNTYRMCFQVIIVTKFNGALFFVTTFSDQLIIIAKFSDGEYYFSGNSSKILSFLANLVSLSVALQLTLRTIYPLYNA